MEGLTVDPSAVHAFPTPPHCLPMGDRFSAEYPVHMNAEEAGAKWVGNTEVWAKLCHAPGTTRTAIA
jgi:hypothetical protein